MTVLSLPLAGYALRSVRATDAADLILHANDPDLASDLSENFPHPYTTEHATDFLTRALANTVEQHLAITHNDRLVGMMGIVSSMSPSSVFAELGYWVGRTESGKGLATLALTTYAEHLLSSHPALNRLEALIYPHNIASQRVLEKAGFFHDATLKGRARHKGRIVDDILYARLRPA